MPIIDTRRWIPSPDEPGKMIPDGQRTYSEVFQDLKQHLTSIGYQPDEYLLLSMDQRDGTSFPEDAYLSQNVNFGGSEGIYLDASVTWEDESGYHKDEFFTGKTLGTSFEDMNQMNLIAAATLYAFHGHADHTRYLKLGVGESPADGLTVHLDSDERDIVADALFEARNYQKACGSPYQKTENLLRRMVGSIIEYMQLVGERPAELTAFDAAELAIKENNMDVFLEQYPVAPNHGALFLKAAAQPGRVGAMMTDHLMMGLKDIPPNSYLDACISVIKNGETERLQNMLKVADEHLAEPYPELFGIVVKHAYTQYDDNIRGHHIAKALVENATEDEIRTVPPALVTSALQHNDTWLADRLLRGGVELGREAGDAIYAAAASRHDWFLERMVTQYGVDIDANNYGALRACKRMTNLDAAKIIIDCGADFGGFKAAFSSQYQGFGETQFMQSMEAYCQSKVQEAAESATQEEDQGMDMQMN